MILLAGVVAAGVAAGLAQTGPDRYQSSAVFKVGRVNGVDLDDAYAVAEIIKSAGFQAAVSARAGRRVYASSATVTKGGLGRLEHPVSLTLTATGTSPQDAVDTGQAAADEIVARHAKLYADSIAPMKEYEKVLAVTGEPASGPADPAARKDLWELRSRIYSPVSSIESSLQDPFPVPTGPIPRNTVSSAGVAFLSVSALAALLVLAVGSARSKNTLNE